MADDPRRALEVLGGTPVPPPRPELSDELGERLRAMHPRTAADAPPPAGRGRRLVLVALAAAAAVVVAVLLVPDEGRGELELVVADGVEVVSPDGDVIAGEPGLELEEGAVVRVAEGGRAEAGGVVVGPGEEAEVVDGQLRMLGGRDTATTSTTSTSLGERTTTTSPPPTAAPERTTTSVADRTTVPPPERQPPPSDPDRLRLEARAGDGAVALRWSAYTGRGFDRYALLRSDARQDPSWPADRGTVVVVELGDPASTAWRDQPPGSADVAYRVVAVDAGGNVLAHSDTVRP